MIGLERLVLENVNLERIVMKRTYLERTGLARYELERIEWEKVYIRLELFGLPKKLTGKEKMSKDWLRRI